MTGHQMGQLWCGLNGNVIHLILMTNYILYIPYSAVASSAETRIFLNNWTMPWLLVSPDPEKPCCLLRKVRGPLISKQKISNTCVIWRIGIACKNCDHIMSLKE